MLVVSLLLSSFLPREDNAAGAWDKTGAQYSGVGQVEYIQALVAVPKKNHSDGFAAGEGAWRLQDLWLQDGPAQGGILREVAVLLLLHGAFRVAALLFAGLKRRLFRSGSSAGKEDATPLKKEKLDVNALATVPILPLNSSIRFLQDSPER